jgi:UDP-N-acetylmuramate dehydrogenase
MEFAFALPGSVGGAVWMNARCYEREVSDVLEFVDYLDVDVGQRRLAMRHDDWAYKLSPFQAMRGVILRAGFRLAPAVPAKIEEQMQEHRKDREKKGHFLFPCAGSVFKNNRAFGAPTGVLVDSLGLKGRRIGGAQVAPFHGNIIINTGGATARDVLTLMELVENEVRIRLGFHLEREVLLVGEW